MNDRVIVSNNPEVLKIYSDDIVNVEGAPLDVMRKVKEMLSEGYILWSSPLPPNGRLMRNPFRSVVLKKGDGDRVGGRDFLLAENAVERLGRREFLDTEGKQGKDLAYMDLTLLKSALRDI